MLKAFILLYQEGCFGFHNRLFHLHGLMYKSHSATRYAEAVYLSSPSASATPMASIDEYAGFTIESLAL